MPKGSAVTDISERLLELGQSTVKKTGQAVKQTFDPTKLAEHAAGKSMESGKQANKTESAKDPVSHTPLDLENLKNQYKKEDEAKQKELENRLFRLVKEGEKEVVRDKEQEETEKQRQEMIEAQAKQKQEDRKLQEQSAEEPRGKERKSIFSRKKKIREKHAEYKPATGKS